MLLTDRMTNNRLISGTNFVEPHPPGLPLFFFVFFSLAGRTVISNHVLITNN